MLLLLIQCCTSFPVIVRQSICTEGQSCFQCLDTGSPEEDNKSGTTLHDKGSAALPKQFKIAYTADCYCTSCAGLAQHTILMHDNGTHPNLCSCSLLHKTQVLGEALGTLVPLPMQPSPLYKSDAAAEYYTYLADWAAHDEKC